jgi:hypothetical protein
VSHDGTCFGVRNIKGLGLRIRVVLRIAGAGGGAVAAEGVGGSENSPVDCFPDERPRRPSQAGVVVQTFTPLVLVAKTGRPMWSVRTKLVTPPSITAIGSQFSQTYSRISAPMARLYSAIRRP